MAPARGGEAIGLRPVRPEDRDSLLAVYASTRSDELALTSWSAAEKDAFVRMQFDAQDRFYRTQFPQADLQLIVAGDRTAGRLYLDRRSDEIRVLDIALLPEFRGRGIGTRLLGAVAAEAEASGRAVRINVEAGNRARALYERLGFTEVGRSDVHALMERPCGTWPD